MSDCEVHGNPRRTEPLRRSDGQQIGSLTIEVCDQCDAQAADDWDDFCYRVSTGDFPECSS